jgi:hypothetical protein
MQTNRPIRAVALDATTSTGYGVFMSEEFSDQLRRAIRESGASRYQISKETGVSQAVLCRFAGGTAGMSLASIDAVMRFLKLEIRPRKQGRK